jgi:hypothetical protein
MDWTAVYSEEDRSIQIQMEEHELSGRSIRRFCLEAD